MRDLCAAPESAEGDAERLLEPDDVEELCRELLRPAIESLCTEVETCEEGEDAKRGLLEAALSRVYESRGEVCLKYIVSMLRTSSCNSEHAIVRHTRCTQA